MYSEYQNNHGWSTYVPFHRKSRETSSPNLSLGLNILDILSGNQVQGE